MLFDACKWENVCIERKRMKVNKFICHRKCNCVLNVSASFSFDWEYGRNTITKWTCHTRKIAKMTLRRHDGRVNVQCTHRKRNRDAYGAQFHVCNSNQTNSICLWRASTRKWLTIENVHWQRMGIQKKETQRISLGNFLQFPIFHHELPTSLLLFTFLSLSSSISPVLWLLHSSPPPQMSAIFVNDWIGKLAVCMLQEISAL